MKAFLCHFIWSCKPPHKVGIILHVRNRGSEKVSDLSQHTHMPYLVRTSAQACTGGRFIACNVGGISWTWACSALKPNLKLRGPASPVRTIQERWSIQRLVLKRSLAPNFHSLTWMKRFFLASAQSKWTQRYTGSHARCQYYRATPKFHWGKKGFELRKWFHGTLGCFPSGSARGKPQPPESLQQNPEGSLCHQMWQPCGCCQSLAVPTSPPDTGAQGAGASPGGEAGTVALGRVPALSSLHLDGQLKEGHLLSPGWTTTNLLSTLQFANFLYIVCAIPRCWKW